MELHYFKTGRHKPNNQTFGTKIRKYKNHLGTLIYYFQIFYSLHLFRFFFIYNYFHLLLFNTILLTYNVLIDVLFIIMYLSYLFVIHVDVREITELLNRCRIINYLFFLKLEYCRANSPILRTVYIHSIYTTNTNTDCALVFDSDDVVNAIECLCNDLNTIIYKQKCS